MDNISFESQDFKKIFRLLAIRIILSIIAGGAVGAMAWFISNKQMLHLPPSLFIIAGFLMALLILIATSRLLVADIINKKKTIEKRTAQKQEDGGFFKQMESPVSARCTQKQSFGSNADSAPNEHEVYLGDEKFILTPALFQDVKNGDELAIHRAAQSRILLQIEKV